MYKREIPIQELLEKKPISPYRNFFEGTKSQLLTVLCLITGTSLLFTTIHLKNNYDKNKAFNTAQKNTHALSTFEIKGDTILVNEDKYLHSDDGRIALYVDNKHAVKIVEGIEQYPGAEQSDTTTTDDIYISTNGISTLPVSMSSSGNMSIGVPILSSRTIKKKYGDNILDLRRFDTDNFSIYSPDFKSFPHRDVFITPFDEKDATQAEGDFFNESKLSAAYRVIKIN